MTFTPGDRVRWVDDPSRTGTVLKVSDQVRRDHNGTRHPELPPMVHIQWDRVAYLRGRIMWEASELLRRIES